MVQDFLSPFIFINFISFKLYRSSREAHSCVSFLQVCLPEGILEEPEKRDRLVTRGSYSLRKNNKGTIGGKTKDIKVRFDRTDPMKADCFFLEPGVLRQSEAHKSVVIPVLCFKPVAKCHFHEEHLEYGFSGLKLQVFNLVLMCHRQETI